MKSVMAVATDKPTAPVLPLEEPTSALTTVIEPSSGWAALNLREVWQFRDLLVTFVWGAFAFRKMERKFADVI